MTTAAKKYLEVVRESCPSALRKRLVPELQGSVSEYAEAHPQDSLDALIIHFGEPDQIVQEYLANLEDFERIGLIRKTRWIKTAVVVGLVVFVSVVIFAAAWIISENSRHVAYDYSEAEISEIL